MNDKYKFKLNFITLKDYDELTPYEAIVYDKREFYIVFFDLLKEENVVINLLFHYSLMEPLWVRLILFFLNLNLNFALNAFFSLMITSTLEQIYLYLRQILSFSQY